MVLSIKNYTTIQLPVVFIGQDNSVHAKQFRKFFSLHLQSSVVAKETLECLIY